MEIYLVLVQAGGVRDRLSVVYQLLICDDSLKVCLSLFAESIDHDPRRAINLLRKS